MREIEYRAWDVENKIMFSWEDLIEFWEEEGFVDGVFRNDHWICMQWSGLYDKNKKKIYEGDIVKYKNSIESGIFEIKYDNCEFYADWKESNNFMENTTSMKYLQCSNELEVIGNIYENGDEMNE